MTHAMAQSTITMQRVSGESLSPEQQLGAVAMPHLLEQLRNIFETYETALLDSGESVKTCCELRRGRRIFLDGFVRQWCLRCESPDSSWLVGSAANAAHTRTFIYLSKADQAVRELYLQQAEGIGKVSAGWTQFVGKPVNPLSCPLAPYTLTRLFFLFVPELPAPVRIRHGLAQLFMQQLPVISLTLQKTVMAFWQRIGLAAHTLMPQALPENWVMLEKYRMPSVAARALVAPAPTVERVAVIADDIARAALAGDTDDLLSLLSAYRQTTLLPWLAGQLGDTSFPPCAHEVLSLLAGPLVMASTDEHFADVAHPARRVLEELLHWAPGWVGVAIQNVQAFGVADQCLHYSRMLASALVESGQGSPSELDSANWLEMLDFLLSLRKSTQQEASIAVASTRLSIQVLEVRAEVENLLRNRAGPDVLPRAVVEILSDTWIALLMGIHWREGTASDAWLSAIAVADELLASVQSGMSKADLLQSMQRVPHLLQQLRKGFDSVNVERSVYSAYLDRLEQVHMALLQGRCMPEDMVYWPEPLQLPATDEAFEVGQWLQEDESTCWRVLFSDELCTVLVDTETAGLVCCATFALQQQFYNGELLLLASPEPMLANSADR